MRTFFERIIEWDYDDAPRRVPIFAGDFPKRDEPLPRFLDDPTAAKFMATLADDPDRRRRLMVELLARTGMRAGELGGVRDDAVFRHEWCPLAADPGREAPQRPQRSPPPGAHRPHRRLPGPARSESLGTAGRPQRRPTLRPSDRPPLRGRGGTPGGHRTRPPHQLRHTLATQLINRGMSLEAIAEMLGHRSPRMTLVYARISNDSVAEQYFRATQAVEVASNASVVDEEARLLARSHPRLLANGRCTRPAQLDCSYQTICEGCGFFETGPEFIPILRRQKDNAVEQADFERTHIFQELIDGLTTDKPLGRNAQRQLPVHRPDDRS